VGISDGNTEIFSYYAGSAGGPARISDDLTGKQRDLEGLQIEIRGGSDYQVNIYPATNEIPREGNLKISHLRSETTAFASQSIRLPVCTLFPKT
jgi:ribosomal protein S6E (S10)